MQYRSFHTKHALMCKIREPDRVSLLKHVLCTLMNMPIFFFHMKMFNVVIIKKTIKLLTIDRN